MSAPAVVHPSEAGHWYTRTGEPMYEVPSRAGTPRPTTLRDARTMLLVPGVTTIIKCAAAPGLVNWMIDQGILAALTLPRGADEAEADWLVRVKRDSQEQGRAAAERGTEIHARIEAWYGTQGVTATNPYVGVVESVANTVFDRFGDLQWHAELSFAHPWGFGGKADLLGEPAHPHPVLIDFKTKDPWPDDQPPRGFEEHAMQLAAYREGLGRPEATCANVFVSRAAPWQVHIYEWTEEAIQRGWRMFRALLDYWRHKTGYDPAWDVEGECDAISF